MIFNAAKLRLFDVIERHGMPVSARDIARDMSLPETSVRMLESLLRACSCLGLLAKSRSDDNQGMIFLHFDIDLYLCLSVCIYVRVT